MPAQCSITRVRMESANNKTTLMVLLLKREADISAKNFIVY